MRHLQRASAIGILVAILGAGLPGAEAPATQVVTLRGKHQTLHLYGARGGRPVIVSSGDGGWIHLGPEIAEALAARGYFVLGFDVKAYLSSFTSGDTALRMEDEPGDYLQLVRVAAGGCRGRPVLIGVSEGGALSVLAASDGSVRPAIQGVIALGLGDVNELAWRWRDSIIYLTHGVPGEPAFSVSSVIGMVRPSPLAMIHSSRDEYVPADEARALFDRAREPKRFWLVSAGNHRFGGATEELNRCLVEALAWILEARPPATGSTACRGARRCGDD